MKLIALDTSGPVCGVALLEDGSLVYESLVINRMTHSRNLMPMLEEALTRMGWQLADADLLACTVGPGSFTGVRLGVEAVKATAHALKKQVVPVDALEAYAYAFRQFDGLICPIQDARAGQVYAALFQGGDFARRMADEPIRLDLLCSRLEEMKQPCIFVGDGLSVHEKAINAYPFQLKPLVALACQRPLHASWAAELAWQRRDTAVDWEQLEPLYLRAPQAERQRNLMLQQGSAEESKA